MVTFWSKFSHILASVYLNFGGRKFANFLLHPSGSWVYFCVSTFALMCAHFHFHPAANQTTNQSAVMNLYKERKEARGIKGRKRPCRRRFYHFYLLVTYLLLCWCATYFFFFFTSSSVLHFSKWRRPLIAIVLSVHPELLKILKRCFRHCSSNF